MKSKKLANDKISNFCKALKKYDNFLLSCHVAPEGDAIGSMLAMDSLLRRLGKKTTIVCEDPFPARLPCLSSKRWNQPRHIKKLPGAFQALVVTDCPNLDRIGKVKKWITSDTVVFNIDHHISNIFFGDHNYVCPDASATGEVVFDIYEHLRVKLTKEDAKNMYVAISTDTGSFKNGTTTAYSHQIAAKLISTGIDTETINDQIYGTYHLNKTQLYSRLFGRIKTTSNGKIVWVGMRRADLKHSGATYEDTEGFIDFLKYMKEVKIAFFMTEQAGGDVKVSFRSKGRYDVNKVATYFNGGGHKKASGCVIQGSIKNVEKAILKQVRKELRSK